MAKPRPNQLLHRGWILLLVGVVTSWIFGLGLLFILAATVCALIAVFHRQAWPAALLLFASCVIATVISLHVAAIAGIYAFNKLRSADRAEVPPIAERAESRESR